MFSFILLSLVASIAAAPQFYHHHHGPDDSQLFMPSLGNDNGLFDTKKFWSDITQELQDLDDMLTDFTKKFPSSVTSEGLEGNEYKISIPLSGFDEKDIIVKAREGLLMIQANHKYPGGSVRNYLDLRTMPRKVNVKGTWVFENSVLKITFPLKAGVTDSETVTVVTTDVTTRAPVEREEIDVASHEDNNVDADVGLTRGDQTRDTEIMTNEIPDGNVEATTYAVDLKDEVEFVPVRY